MGVEAFRGHGRRDWKDVAAKAWRWPRRPDGGVEVLAAREDIERSRATQAGAEFERYSRAGLQCVRRRLRQDQRGAAAGALVIDDLEARLPGCVCAADRNVVVRAESRQIAACPKGDEALVPEELAIPVIRQIVQPGFVRDQKSALQLDPCVIDRGVEPAALALLRLQVGGH